MVVDQSTRNRSRSDDHIESQSRDRGQIILIGAIALAFIILGIVVVFNGVLYTETISSSSTGQSAADATVTQHELEKGIAGIVHRENIEGENYDTDDYGSLFQKVTANSNAVITDIEEHPDSNTDAIVSIGDGSELYGENISEDGEETHVGHFVLEIEQLDSDIEVRNSDRTVTVDNEMVDSAPARVDLVDGTVNGTPHPDLELFDPGIGYEEVIVEDDYEGGYELVTREDNTLGGENGVWAIEATVTYESNDVSFEQRYEFPIYGGDT